MSQPKPTKTGGKRSTAGIAESGWWPTPSAAPDEQNDTAVEQNRLYEWPEEHATALSNPTSLGGLEDSEAPVSLQWTVSPDSRNSSKQSELSTPAGMEIPPPVLPQNPAIKTSIPEAPNPAPQADVPRERKAATETWQPRRFPIPRRMPGAVAVALIVGALALAIARYYPDAEPEPAFQPVSLVESVPAPDLPALLQDWAEEIDIARQINTQFPEVEKAVLERAATVPLLPGDQMLVALSRLAPDNASADTLQQHRVARLAAALTEGIQSDAGVPEGFYEIAAQLYPFADEHPIIIADSIDQALDFDTGDTVRYEFAKAFDGLAAADRLNAARAERLYAAWRGRLTNGGALAAMTFLKPRLALRNADTVFAARLPDALHDVVATACPLEKPFALAALRDVYHNDSALGRAHAAALENSVFAALSDGRVERAVAYYRARSSRAANIPSPRLLVDVLQAAERALSIPQQLVMYAQIEATATFPEQQMVADHRRTVLLRQTRRTISEGTFVLAALQWQSTAKPQSYSDLMQVVYPVVEQAVEAKELDRNALQALIRRARASEDADLAARLSALRDRRWPPLAPARKDESGAEHIPPQIASEPVQAVAAVDLAVTGPAEGQTKVSARLTNPAGQPIPGAYVQLQLNIGSTNAHAFIAQADADGVAVFNVTRYIITTRELPPSTKFTYRVSAVELDAKPYEAALTIGELVERFW